MKLKKINLFLSLLASIFLLASFIACSKKIQEPEEVVMSFIKLCEEGKVDEAQKLLASKNNVDYFKKFKERKKDMLFIDYDYKGNDDVLEINASKVNKSDEIAIVLLETNYKIQQHKFSKNIILHKENNEWKIYEYPSLYPVKVK